MKHIQRNEEAANWLEACLRSGDVSRVLSSDSLLHRAQRMKLKDWVDRHGGSLVECLREYVRVLRDPNGFRVQFRLKPSRGVWGQDVI